MFKKCCRTFEIIPVTLGGNIAFDAPAYMRRWQFTDGSYNQIVFHYNSDWPDGEVEINSTTDEDVRDDHEHPSDYPIYMIIEGSVCHIHTPASIIQAPTVCDGMFSNVTSIDFGKGFRTDNVTSMNGIFSGCGSLSSLDLSTFASPSLQDAANMFAGCGELHWIRLGANFTIPKDFSGENGGGQACANALDGARDRVVVYCNSISKNNISDSERGNYPEYTAIFHVIH